jgi:hypothetical protein
MSRSTAKALSRWRKDCKTPGGRSAEPPFEHRSDSLSAASRNLAPDARDDLTGRYDDLCAHYGMTPTRNNKSVAHENGSVESSHNHLKSAIKEARQMRGGADFADLAAYRRFVDEIVSRHNARNRPHIDAEREQLKNLPDRGTSHYDEVGVRVISSAGFTLRKVFYTVPSRLISHQLRVRLYDDRLDVFIGGTPLMTLPRGRAHPSGRHVQVVNYRHVIHALRKKPMALLNLVYRDQRFPREAFRRTFDALQEGLPDRQACRIMVDLLALAMERGCEAELAEALAAILSADDLPDMAALRARFMPDPAQIPTVVVTLAPLQSYEALLDDS